jgi:excisionase family DNA binding protein
MGTTRDRMEVLTPSEEEVSAARQLEAKLRSTPGSHVRLVFTVEGEEHVLLGQSGRFVRALIHEIARGRPVGLVDLERDLSTTEAAELLGVSRPTLVRLLKQDLIPYRQVGSHRRVPHAALLEYRKQHAAAPRPTREERLHAVDELVRLWHEAEESAEP